jgi:hypothetical protein
MVSPMYKAKVFPLVMLGVGISLQPAKALTTGDLAAKPGDYIVLTYTNTFSHNFLQQNSWAYTFPAFSSLELNPPGTDPSALGNLSDPNGPGLRSFITDRWGHGSVADFDIFITQFKIQVPDPQDPLKSTFEGRYAVGYFTNITPKCNNQISHPCEDISSSLELWTRTGIGDLKKWPVAKMETTEVPGPLPILGVFATLGFSRKLRKRIKSSKPEVISTTAV